MSTNRRWVWMPIDPDNVSVRDFRSTLNRKLKDLDEWIRKLSTSDLVGYVAPTSYVGPKILKPPVYLGTEQTNNALALATINTLQVVLAAGDVLYFDAVIYLGASSTGGANLSIATLSGSNFDADTWCAYLANTTGSTVFVTGRLGIMAGVPSVALPAIVSYAAGATPSPVRIWGRIPSAAGMTLCFKFAPVVAAQVITVKLGGFITGFTNNPGP